MIGLLGHSDYEIAAEGGNQHPTQEQKGKYVYVSNSFFRLIPNVIPGAYRIFANLLSLPEAGK